MVALNNEIAKISIKGRVAVVLGLILAIFFVYQVFAANNELDTKYVGNFMMAPADEMSELRSISGESLAESYYQKHGQYLLGEAKIYNASIITEIRQVTTQSLIGFILSIGLALYGSTLHTRKS